MGKNAIGILHAVISFLLEHVPGRWRRFAEQSTRGLTPNRQAFLCSPQGDILQAEVDSDGNHLESATINRSLPVLCLVRFELVAR